MIQVHTLDSVYQCHSSPEDARLSCPRSEDIREGEAREVMLYKTRGYYGARDSFAKVCLFVDICMHKLEQMRIDLNWSGMFHAIVWL